MLVAFIPARGGSKRLPRKNILPFGGAPLLAHSIRVAKAIGRVDRCIVSTDDPEIAAVAVQHGADVTQTDDRGVGLLLSLLSEGHFGVAHALLQRDVEPDPVARLPRIAPRLLVIAVASSTERIAVPTEAPA